MVKAKYDLKRIEELKHRATKSPKFNLIKVRRMWLLRKTIDNGIFRNLTGQAAKE
ncbi:MAG: hypothetical protein WBZ36_30085 [Candidatus Nitrosopolaris sp.]